MDRLLHHYCFFFTYSRALLPLLPTTSISLLLITSITSHYFHIKQYFWLHYCIITTLLLLNYDLDVRNFSLLPLFVVVMDSLLHHYFFIATWLGAFSGNNQPVPKAYRKCCVEFRTTSSVRTGFPAVIQHSLSEHLK
jgi:hypothetical protein